VCLILDISWGISVAKQLFSEATATNMSLLACVISAAFLFSLLWNAELLKLRRKYGSHHPNRSSQLSVHRPVSAAQQTVAEVGSVHVDRQCLLLDSLLVQLLNLDLLVVGRCHRTPQLL